MRNGIRNRFYVKPTSKYSRVGISGLLLSASFLAPTLTRAAIDFKTEFADREACLLIMDIKSGKTTIEYNHDRCLLRFPPCSSFKIAAALMLFENGILKDDHQLINWDGKKRDRIELNQNHTPYTWMEHSALWVTQSLMPQLGIKAIEKFLDALSYGNRDFSGGVSKAWQTSTLKISAQEQVALVARLWKEQLPLAKRTQELTKKILFIQELGHGAQLYGKTGTGCLTGKDCMTHPGKMLGWFVGVIRKDSKEYAFAANASDLKAQKLPGGARLRQTVLNIVEKLDLAK